MYFMITAAILDFFDGFAARMLNVKSEIGAQLDSLADAVSFGTLPGIILFQLISISLGDYFTPLVQRDLGNIVLESTALLVPMISILRLAKFNLDKNQTMGFIGLPTPAAALFIGSFPLILSSYNFNFYNPLGFTNLSAIADNMHWGEIKLYTATTLQNTYFLIGISLIISFLLISKVKLIALKFSGFGWDKNKDKFVFLILCAGLILFAFFPYIYYIKHFPIIDFLVIPVIIILYIVYSIIITSRNTQQVDG